MIISLTDDQPNHRLSTVSNDRRLGYLLKHAQQQFSELTATRFAPLGISGREAGVLRAVGRGGEGPASQGEVARRLGVDRTTMVALIDDLQNKGLVLRRQDPDDRRKNAVELTDAGRVALRRADEAADEVERSFLAPLTDAEAEQFRRALRVLMSDPGRS
jgi:DNA-binding MarR family transcriptional regulator